MKQYKDPKFYEGKFAGNYKETFERIVTTLLALSTPDGAPPTLVFRKKAITTVCDAYIEQTGFVPEGAQVQRLANWLLVETLTDNHPDKVSKEDYPIMSKRQLRTRYSRERADEKIPETLTKLSYLGGKKQSNYNKSE